MSSRALKKLHLKDELKKSEEVEEEEVVETKKKNAFDLVWFCNRISHFSCRWMMKIREQYLKKLRKKKKRMFQCQTKLRPLPGFHG